MQLKKPLSNLLDQLRYVLELITNEQYTQPVKVLSNSTVGQHTRHILEFFIELNNGYATGTVDYDKRVRDHSIESDKMSAIQAISEIENKLAKPDRDLLLNAEHNEADLPLVPTNYLRELVYNMDHTVHHMAIIRIGITAISEIEIPEEFGIAASTLKYRRACAQ